MELSIDLGTAERIALGLLSFIALIAWCRWRGTPEHQQKDEPAQLPKRGERKNETVEINPSSVRLMARSSREEFRSAFRPLMLFVAGIRILQTLREKKPHRKLVGIVLSAPTSRSGRVSNGSPHLLCCCRLKLLKRASGFGLCVAYIVLLNRTS